MRAAPEQADAQDTPTIADQFPADELRRLIWARAERLASCLRTRRRICEMRVSPVGERTPTGH